MNVLSLADAMPPRAPLQKNTGKNGVFAALPARPARVFRLWKGIIKHSMTR
jgi:hypothetical protein